MGGKIDLGGWGWGSGEQAKDLIPVAKKKWGPGTFKSYLN